MAPNNSHPVSSHLPCLSLHLVQLFSPSQSHLLFPGTNFRSFLDLKATARVRHCPRKGKGEREQGKKREKKQTNTHMHTHRHLDRKNGDVRRRRKRTGQDKLNKGVLWRGARPGLQYLPISGLKHFQLIAKTSTQNTEWPQSQITVERSTLHSMMFRLPRAPCTMICIPKIQFKG